MSEWAQPTPMPPDDPEQSHWDWLLEGWRRDRENSAAYLRRHGRRRRPAFAAGGLVGALPSGELATLPAGTEVRTDVETADLSVEN